MKATETVRVYRCGAGEGATLKRGHGSQPERIHAHVEHSIAFVHRGATRATVGSTSIDLGEGQFIVIPPGVPHLCAPEHPAGFLYSVVYGTSAITAALRHAGLGDIGVAVGASPRSIMVTLDELFFSSRRRDDSEELIDLLARCLAGAQTAYGPFRSILESPPPDDGVVSRYQRFRRYKRRYGVGPHGVMQNARIEESKRLLRTGVPIAEVAAQCGFFDQSHYVRTFRRYTGLSPSIYRARS